MDGGRHQRAAAWGRPRSVNRDLRIFALSALFAFVLPQSEARRILKEIGNYWLGVLLYMIFVIVLADIARLFFALYFAYRS